MKQIILFDTFDRKNIDIEDESQVKLTAWAHS